MGKSRSQKGWGRVLLGAWLLCSGASIAAANDSAPVSADVADQKSLGDLGAIMSETQLTNAAAELLEAKAKLSTAAAAYAQASGQAPVTQDGDQRPLKSSGDGGRDAPPPTPPTVRGVYGSTGVRWATLVYAGGDAHDVQPGEPVIPGCVLGDVSVSRVRMKCGELSRDLIFSANPPAYPEVQRATAVPQMPNGMPISGMPAGVIPPGMAPGAH